MNRFRIAALGASLAAVLFVPAAAAEPSAERAQGWLGASLTPVQNATKGSDSPVPGVLVQGVVDGGSAERAGLRSRDVILSVGGAAAASPTEFVSSIKNLDPGAWITLRVRRGKRELNLDVRLENRPKELGALPMVEGYVGARAIDLPPDLREHFGAPRDAGVMISSIVSGSPAEQAGLSLGDVVFEADGEPVRSIGGFASRVMGSGVGNDLSLRVMRDGAEIAIDVPVEKAPKKRD